MLKKILSSACVCASLALSTLHANAGTVTLNAITNGWWATETGDGPGIGITLTGFTNINILGNEYRSFYVFDTSTITDRIKSATFLVRRGFQTESLTLGLWDVTSPADVLRYGSATDSELVAAVHSDLGSGKSYGAFSIVDGEPSDYLKLILNNRALSDLHKSSGNFVIGTSVLGYKPDSLYKELLILGATGTHDTSLILDLTPIPEPATWALVLIGAAGIYGRKYKQRHC